MNTIISVSPHPDDGAIGAPMMLAALRRKGWRVIDLLVSLGRRDQHDRRLGEWNEWLERSGFDGIVVDPPLHISSTDETRSTEREVATKLQEIFDEESPLIVMSPHFHDIQTGHELVARGIRLAIEQTFDAPAWWTYGLWSSLQTPNIFGEFRSEDHQEAQFSLAAFDGELKRLDFARFLTSKSVVDSVYLHERKAGGFGGSGMSDGHAELITEYMHLDDAWLYGTGRLFDADAPLAPPTDIDVTPILNSPSEQALLSSLSSDV